MLNNVKVISGQEEDINSNVDIFKLKKRGDYCYLFLHIYLCDK